MSSTILYEAAKETLVEYFQKTSLNGFRLLYYIRRRKCQRLFWFMFIVMGITFAIYVCTTILISFLKDPTVTTLDPQMHSIYDVPFPSVAVCSDNKLSRIAIQNYAMNISLHSENYNLSEYWEYKLELFAGLLNTDSIDFDEALKFHNELEHILGKPFNTRETLKLLAPKCGDLILKCFWAGQTINCEKHFQLMVFIDGTCCVFNYQYKKPLDQVFYPISTGPEMGLTLILNASDSDYFYAEDSTVGFNVKLFGTQRIPDTSIGEMQEFHVCPGEDISVKLNLISQTTMENARIYSVSKRGCYFPYEYQEAVFEHSECLLKCKIRSIESLCGCVPFYADDSEIRNPKDGKVKEQCTLAHSKCLERYRVTWQTYFPINADVNFHLKNNQSEYITCPDCYPSCFYNHYYYWKTNNKLEHTFEQSVYSNYLRRFSEIPPEVSLFTIYYFHEKSSIYQKNVLYNWYQILSTIGGVIGICMGCSIISGIEIIYFGCYRLVENYIKLKKIRKLIK